MDMRRELNRKIERKRAEIEQWEREKAELELKIREGTAYVTGIAESLKLLPKEMASDAAKALRAGSSVAKARETILKAGRPLHINAILNALGKEATHDAKAALSGSLATYVRKGQIFTRPAPNTFGLVELEQEETDQPPPGFGAMDGKTSVDGS